MIRQVLLAVLLAMSAVGAAEGGQPAAEGIAPEDAPFFQTVTTGTSKALYVGRLSSRAFEIVGGPEVTNVQGSGPVDGRVLAWWMVDGLTRVAMVDTTTGEQDPLFERDADIEALLSKDGRTVYWVEMVDGDVRGLFRRAVDGGDRERLADGWDGQVLSMDWSTNAATIVLTGRPAGAEFLQEYRILDVSDGRLRGPLEWHGGNVVGLHDGRLLAYSDPAETGATILTSVSVSDGDVTEPIGLASVYSAIFDDDGRATLVYDDVAGGNRYSLRALPLDGSEGSLLWESGSSFFAPEAAMVRPSRWHAVEAPGWVPVFPTQRAYTEPGYEGPTDRFLVSLADGRVVRLTEQPSLQER